MTASSGDVTFPITEYIFQQSLSDLETAIWSNSFKKKENKDKEIANKIYLLLKSAESAVEIASESQSQSYFEDILDKFNTESYSLHPLN